MDMEKVVDNLTDLKEMLKWQKDIKGYGFYIDFINDAIALLKEQPEIIRCKYCEYLSNPANGVPFCKHIKNFVDADWFCADGKKRPDL